MRSQIRLLVILSLLLVLSCALLWYATSKQDGAFRDTAAGLLQNNQKQFA